VEKINFEYLNLFITDSQVETGRNESIKADFDISPDQFLKFADYDLNAIYEHHLVNSLSNTKRAIDSQLDSLMIGFGLSERVNKWNFPKKINYLNGVGIISPRILNKINKKRTLYSLNNMPKKMKVLYT
jgi:hypothetical protein